MAAVCRMNLKQKYKKIWHPHSLAAAGLQREMELSYAAEVTELGHH